MKNASIIEVSKSKISKCNYFR